MSTSLRDALTQRINQVGPAHPELEKLVGLGEERLRRRRLTAALGAAAAVVVAAAVGIAALNGSGTPRPAPIDRPPPREEKAPARQIVYSDEGAGVVPRHGVHFGDALVETGNDHVHLDVTDDGFLYTYRGGVWFSDGGTPARVGTIRCPAGAHGEFGNFDTGAVMTANSGSTAAWLDCTRPAGPTLVVFDSSSRRVSARQPVPSCCGVVDVTSDYVYVGSSRFDLRTHRLRASTPREHAEDLRDESRGLVLGDDWQSGTPIAGDGRLLAENYGMVRFAAVGSRLVPMISVNDRDRVTSAFDTGTRRVLRLRLPAGYPHRGDSFDLVEWLDDDTVTLFGGGADILSCRLSTGRCVVAVRGPDSDTLRIVPARPLPG